MTFSLGSFMAELSTATQGVFDSLLPVLYLLLGLLLALFIIDYIVSLMRASYDERHYRRGDVQQENGVWVDDETNPY
jgi:hypothetical protein